MTICRSTRGWRRPLRRADRRAVNEAPSSRRVFFALWPDAPLREALAAHGASLAVGGRPVPREHLHLTLIFPGAVPADRVPVLCRQAATVRTAPFTLTLDRIDHFPRAAVAWIGPSATPPALQALADALSGGCEHAGAPGDRRPFRPHVTLRRHIARPARRAVPPVVWPVRDFVLVESGSGGRPGAYAVVERWALAG